MKELGISYQVVIDGKDHPIEFRGTIRPTHGYRIRPFSFEGDLGQEADGSLFDIEPGFATRIAKITDPEFSVKQIAISGYGCLLALNPEGKVVDFLMEDNQKNPLVEMGEGWTYCWVASHSGDGLRVVSLNQPSFSLDVEEIIAYESPQLPREFWNRYCELKGQ